MVYGARGFSLLTENAGSTRPISRISGADSGGAEGARLGAGDPDRVQAGNCCRAPGAATYRPLAGSAIRSIPKRWAKAFDRLPAQRLELDDHEPAGDRHRRTQARRWKKVDLVAIV